MVILQAGGWDIITGEKGWVAGRLARAVVEARRAVRLSPPGWRGEGDFVLHDLYLYFRSMRRGKECYGYKAPVAWVVSEWHALGGVGDRRRRRAQDQLQ